jgi:NodT family efflux transporter outer membrane factor (OMF) lipoprotein
MSLAALLASASLLQGCLAAREQLPDAATIIPPVRWRTEVGPAAPVEADWWRAFDDPALTGLVTRALANNTDLAVAAGRVEGARAEFHLARAQQLPLATISAAADRSRILVLTDGVDGFDVTPEATISYDLDVFGRLRSASASAKASLLASAETRDAVALAVASTTASGYITLIGLDAQLATARATLSARAEALRIARRRTAAGYASQLEFSQAEAEYQATEQFLPAAELAVTRQENALCVLVGDPPHPLARDAALDSLKAPTFPDAPPSSLLERRPDLAAARDGLAASEQALDAARAAQLPDVSLAGTASAAVSTALPNAIGLFSLGGGVLSPLFDAGRLKARSAAAAAQRDQAAFAYRRAALTAFREVEDGRATVERLGEQQVSAESEIATLRNTLRLATNRYRAGYAGYLDQVDAERSLLAVQLVAIQLQTARLTGFVSLYQAMGGGWRQSTFQAARSAPSMEMNP